MLVKTLELKFYGEVGTWLSFEVVLGRDSEDEI